MWIIVILSCIATGIVHALDDATFERTIRVALFSDPAVRAVEEIIAVALSERPDVIIVERREFDRVAAERIALEAGRLSVDALPDLSAADAALIISRSSQGAATNIDVRLVHVGAGAVTAMVKYDWSPSLLDRLADMIALDLFPALSATRRPPEGWCRISFAGLTTSEGRRDIEDARSALEFQLKRRLSATPGFVLLEREASDAILFEKEITAASSELWSGRYLIEGALARLAGPDVRAVLSVTEMATDETRRIERSGRIDDVPALADSLIEALSQVISAPERSIAAHDSQAEARKFMELSAWALNNGLYRSAMRYAEASYALGARDERSRGLRIRAMAAVIYPRYYVGGAYDPKLFRIYGIRNAIEMAEKVIDASLLELARERHREQLTPDFSYNLVSAAEAVAQLLRLTEAYGHSFGNPAAINRIKSGMAQLTDELRRRATPREWQLFVLCCGDKEYFGGGPTKADQHLSQPAPPPKVDPVAAPSVKEVTYRLKSPLVVMDSHSAAATHRAVSDLLAQGDRLVAIIASAPHRPEPRIEIREWSFDLEPRGVYRDAQVPRVVSTYYSMSPLVALGPRVTAALIDRHLRVWQKPNIEARIVELPSRHYTAIACSDRYVFLGFSGLRETSNENNPADYRTSGIYEIDVETLEMRVISSSSRRPAENALDGVAAYGVQALVWDEGRHLCALVFKPEARPQLSWFRFKSGDWAAIDWPAIPAKPQPGGLLFYEPILAYWRPYDTAARETLVLSRDENARWRLPKDLGGLFNYVGNGERFAANPYNDTLNHHLLWFAPDRREPVLIRLDHDDLGEEKVHAPLRLAASHEALFIAHIRGLLWRVAWSDLAAAVERASH